MQILDDRGRESKSWMMERGVRKCCFIGRELGDESMLILEEGAGDERHGMRECRSWVMERGSENKDVEERTGGPSFP